MFNKNRIYELENDNKNLKEEIEKYKHELSSKHFLNEINDEQNTLNDIKSKVQSMTYEKLKLERLLNDLYENDIKDISEIQYMYDFSSQYKQKIDSIRCEQKKVKDVIHVSKGLNDSIIKNMYVADKVYETVAKMMQFNFDIKCDDIMNNVKYNNKNNLSLKIKSLAQRIENQNNILHLEFNKEYINLKVDEVYTVFEYKCKVQDEKEQKIRQQEILKDQAKADKAIKRELDKYEKELVNLKYKYNKLTEQNKDTGEIQSEIDKIQSCINKNNDRLIKDKSGYVYVVGNRDMKDGLIKIGVTKRDIDERMSELGNNASHSFPMEVYGYIFVDDCYEVETKLHKYLNDKRLCVSNPHKEWFIADFDEIKRAFKDITNIDIDLSEKPCEEYLISSKKFVDFY